MTVEEALESRIRVASSLEELAGPLEHLLSAGYALFGGRLLHIRQRVAQINGLRIEVYHREHAPPHFHVTAADIDVTFTVEDCRLLSGTIDRRNRGLVEWWHGRARVKLIEIWNATRPTDCPVGPIPVPEGA